MDSEGRYRQFDEAAQDGILILDPQTGAILDMNPILARMLDYSPVELLGMTLWEIGLPEDAAASKHAFQELIENNSVHYDNLPFVAKGGDPVASRLPARSMRDVARSWSSAIFAGLASPRAPSFRSCTSGTRRRWKPSARSQGVSPMTSTTCWVILKCGELLNGQPALPEASRRLIQEIQNAGTSAQNLTNRLLAFSRGQVAQRIPVDLNETVHRIEGTMRRLVGEGIELVILPGGGLGSVHADPSQLEQVLMNLAANARDAMPKGGKIIIETANIAIEDANAGQYPSMRPGRYVMLSVSDTGTGMDPEIQSRIFEPFFTTKPFGQGTVSACPRSIASWNRAGARSPFTASPAPEPPSKSSFRALSGRRWL